MARRVTAAGWLAALLALALPAGPAAQAADAGAGPRPRLEADRYPWQAFGRLNRQGGGFCTAVLVGAEVVLTAAHCLYDFRAGLWAAPERLHFVAGYQDRGFAFHSRARRYRVGDGYAPSAEPPGPAEAARDWALVWLAEPAPAGLGYLGVARVERDTALSGATELTLAGYGRDRPYALSADRGCRLLGWDSGGSLLVHDCRAVHGTSGAPLVSRRDGGWLVQAIHVARAETEEGKLGLAVPGRAFFEAVRAATGRAVAQGQDGLEFLPGRAGE